MFVSASRSAGFVALDVGFKVLFVVGEAGSAGDQGSPGQDSKESEKAPECPAADLSCQASVFDRLLID